MVVVYIVAVNRLGLHCIMRLPAGGCGPGECGARLATGNNKNCAADSADILLGLSTLLKY